MSHIEQIARRFSMYVCLRDDRYRNRTTLVREYNHVLQEFMTHLVQSEPNASEEYWARFFLKRLITASNTYLILLWLRFPFSSLYLLVISSEICQQLLISYLQLICFYAAKQISSQLKQSPNFKLHYPLEECFTIACEASLNPRKILKNFDFSGNFPLYGYARKALNRIIQNQVVQDFKIRAIKLSDYGLLNSLTPTKLERYLKFYGISTREIFKFRLACQIFQELFLEFFPPNINGTVKKKTIKYLSQQQLQQIALTYNQRLPRMKTEVEASDREEIKRILTICIKAARTAQQRHFLPLEEQSFGMNLVTLEPDRLLQAEKENNWQELKDTILKSFHSLDQNAQIHLLLWLGLEINQTDFIPLLNLQKQYQVARHFQRHQKTILKQVIRVLSPKYLSVNMSLEKANKLCSENLEYIKEYLQNYSKEFMGNILASAITSNLKRTEIEKLIKYLTIEQSSFSDSGVKIYNKLKLIFQECIEHDLKINLSNFKSTDKYLTKFINKWLEQNLAFIHQLTR